MKNRFVFLLALVCCFFILKSCSHKNEEFVSEINVVTDSIYSLIRNYHYNPSELKNDQFIALEKRVGELSLEVKDREEFINKFNALWQDGPFSHVRLDTISIKAEKMADYIDTLKVGEQSVTLEWIDKTSVLTITTMTGLDTKQRIDQAFEKIVHDQAKSLIIDLRNNTGGAFAGVSITGHILKDSIDAGMFVSKKWWKDNTQAPKNNEVQYLQPWHGWSIKSFWRDVQDHSLTRVKLGPIEPHFNGEVFVLIGSKTASAAEFTADALAQIENVTLIGETTAGEMLSQKMYDLPYGYQISLPIAEYYSSRIDRIEGLGVQPDIEINSNVAMDLAISLAGGMSLEDARSDAQLMIDKLKEEPLEGDVLYLFGSMNEWGENHENSPAFEYVGDGKYKTTMILNQGLHEFKIAPNDWKFDYGAKQGYEKISFSEETPVARKAGSKNLTIDIPSNSTVVTFILDLNNTNNAVIKVINNANPSLQF